MTPDPYAAAGMLRDFAEHEKAKLPLEVQAVVDALVLAAEVRDKSFPKKQMIARLRGSHMIYKKTAPVIAAYMASTANQLEKAP